MRSNRSVVLFATVAAALLLPLATGCGSSSSAAGGLQVVDASIDRPPNPQQAAVRMVIRNDSDTADALTGASSSMAKRATIHRTTTDAEGRTGMDMVKKLPIPAGGEVTFDPTTYHVMLEGFAEAPRLGDEIPITFTFAKAGKKTVQAKVIEPGTATEEHDMDHSDG